MDQKPPQKPNEIIRNRTVDGVEEYYDKNGILEARVLPDGTTEQYDGRGTMTHKNGEKLPVRIYLPPKKETEETAAIAKLKETIENAQKTLEENRIARERDNALIERILAGLEKIRTESTETTSKEAQEKIAPSFRDQEQTEKNENISTSEKLGAFFVTVFKNNNGGYLDDLLPMLKKTFPEATIKPIYHPTRAQEIYFLESSDMSSLWYWLVSIDSHNYLLPRQESNTTFASTTEGFSGYATPDKIKKIIPAELILKGKRWEIKTPGSIM